MIKLINSKNKNKDGFVILFSVVVSSIILLVSVGMYNLSKKQVILSSYARESQRAFYAANSALECAYYYDVSPLIQETSFPITAENNYETQINCGGYNVVVSKINTSSTGSDEYTHSFVFRFAGINGLNSYETGCAYVLVEKKKGKVVDGVTNLITRITASGFNVCTKGDSGLYDIPDFDDPTLLERRISSGYETIYYESS
jgi:Tfp pilus assembly protein PilX